MAMPRRALALPLVFALAAAGFAGCGGNDKDEVESTVRDFIKATNDRDADKWCGELVTKDFIEQATGATGDDAKDACKQQLKSLKRPELRLISIDRVKVDGDKAAATAALDTQGQRAPQTFRLEKQDGDWRITTGSGG
jgi:hypothetical protein